MEADRNPKATQPTIQQLNYDPATSRRRSIRRTLLLIIVALIVAIACAMLPTLYRRVVLMRLEHSAFARMLSPETVVFDARSSAMPTLKRSDPNFVSRKLGTRNYVAYLPNDWVRFTARVSASKGSTALIFAGPMQDGSGKSRLVAIEAFDWYTDGSKLVVAAKEYSPGTIRAEPREMAFYTDYPEIHVWSNTVVHAGHIDPQHPNCVVFDVIQSHDHQTWTMQLQNNQFIFDHHDDNARFDPDGPRGTLDGVNQGPPPSPASSH